MAVHSEIAKLLPKKEDLHFLEIGCAPGTILSDFCAEFNYIAHGVEYAADSEDIKTLLRNDGVRIGEIHREDFFNWTPPRQYDIVASFGFIEHFNNADEVLDRHFAICAPGGLVVIVVPNFARGQFLLRWIFDRENLRRHNTKIMNLKFFCDALKRNRATMIEAAFAGGNYGFWREPDTPMAWIKTRLYWRADRALKQIATKLPCDSNKYLSPYLYAVMQKPL